MKKLILCLVSVMFLAGCATTKELDPNYMAYLNEIKAQREAPREPLLVLTLDANGLVRDLRVTLPPDRVEIRPYEPKIHPAWRLAGTTVKAAATVVGIGLVSDMITDLANVAGHNNYYSDSFNKVGRDYNHLHDIHVADEGVFAPKWDYSTKIKDSYNTDIKDSFHFGSHNTYSIDGDDSFIQQGDWNLGAMPWDFLE